MRQWIHAFLPLLLAALTVGGPVAPAQPADPPGHAYRTDLGEIYRPAAEERIFANEAFQWDHVPDDLSRGPALRVPLNQETIRIEVARPGYLIAVLWAWDFGFLAHLPDTERLHGWQAWHRDAPMRVAEAPRPFNPPRMYRRPVTPGVHELTLAEYFGQWVLVGFQEDGDVAASPASPGLSLEGGRTAHHVVAPGAEVRIHSAGEDVQAAIFRHSEVVRDALGTVFDAPREPGRYVIRAESDAGVALFPLTVGYGQVEEAGWPAHYFPVHFYTGYWYRGVFNPNPKVLEDLTFLSMFELGANTFFTTSPHELVDALGGRQIVGTVGRTKRWVRADDVSDSEAARFVLSDVREIIPQAPANLLGYYVDDEPNVEHAGRMQAVEAHFQQAVDRQQHLLYCLGGWAAPEFWEVAGSTVRMIRSYPIRKMFADDYASRITDELSDPMIEWQPEDDTARLWLVLQAFGDQTVPGLWNLPNAEQMRLMTNLALSRGARALSYFVHDSSPDAVEDLQGVVRWPFVPEDPDMHKRIRDTNAVIHEHAPFLASLRWIRSIKDDGSDLDVQLLTDDKDRLHVWITNPSDKEERTGRVDLDEHGTIEVSLEPGQGKVFDVEQKRMRFSL